MALHQQERDGRHGMQENRAIQNLPTTTPSPLASDEEIMADVDEPPDDQCTPRPFTSPYPPFTPAAFGKTTPRHNQRKESLLTNALTSSGTGSPVEESNPESTTVSRGLSCASTWSNNSTASTAELTSDGGFTSPGTRTSTPSPPPPSTTFRSIAPIFNKKPFDQPVSIIRHDDENIGPLHKQPTSALTENIVEASLGRKRCITFACGRNDTPKSPPAASPPKATTEQSIAPSKRACTIKFACPTKISTEGPSSGNKPRNVRPVSPAPTAVRLCGSLKASPKLHRGSDSTVRNESPQSVRKPFTMRPRKLSGNSDLARSEAFRFHEFASSEEEVDEWLQESTCHRSRLTITDTLKVENTLRQLGEEVEEEVLEDEHEADLDDDEDVEDEDDDMDDEDTEDHEDVEDACGDVSDVSDEGFQTDDEEGFAGSDDDSDTGSDYHWWTPGRSTAATSMDQLDHIRPISKRSVSESSIGSADSVSGSSKMAAAASVSKRRKSRPVVFRAASPELPDSTDFVCGTLDEDRPLEEAYMSCLERRRAAKHRVTPQDIDPTFPTSDPEMDEEDEEDVDHVADESDQHLMMHGQMDPHEDTELRGRRKDGLKKRSPAQSPKRLRSPPPLIRRGRSPPPRRLFGQSPKRLRSPLPTRLRSPPPTRRSSVIISPRRTGLGVRFAALAERPPIMEASSLPRTPVTTNISEDSDNGDDTCCELPTRGAIDIKIGLERKRLRRKEKLYQKMHRKACKEKEKRPQPGKGAERMREMGMELAAHKGRKTCLAGLASHSKVDEDMHMLSV